MKIIEILKMPTVDNKIHESIFRCYHILEKVEYYLACDVPRFIILELIEEMKGGKNGKNNM